MDVTVDLSTAPGGPSNDSGERLGVGERLDEGSVAIPRVNVKRHRLADGDVSAQRSPRGEHRGGGVDLRERSLRGKNLPMGALLRRTLTGLPHTTPS